MVERHYQLNELDAAVEACANGSGGFILVEGGLGTGKTSLLKAIRDRAAADDFIILQSRSSKFEKTFPYGTVRQLFEHFLAAATPEERATARSGPAALAAPLFDYQPSAATADTVPAEGEAILRGLHWMLVNLSEKRPVLLLLDDLHWADDDSLCFLHYIEGRLERHQILCVAATASVECGDGTAVTQALLTSPAVHTIPVDVLSEEAVQEVLSAVLHGPPDPALVQACHRATDGNPYFLRELIASLWETHAVDGAWTPESVARIGPRNVAMAVQRWIRHLPPEHVESARSLAHALAVLGGSADSDQVATVTGLTQQEVAEAASALSDIGIIEAGTSLRYLHPIVRTAVYEHMPRSYRYRTHSSVAQALARRGASPSEVAAHLLHAPPAKDGRVAEILMAAGRRALQQGSPPLAVALFRRAYRESVGDEVLPRLLADLGEAEHRACATGAIEHLTRALELATDPVARSAIALNLSGALSVAVRYKDALELLQNVYAEVEGTHEEQAMRLRCEIIKLAQLSPATRPLVEHILAGIDTMSARSEPNGAGALLDAQRAFESLLNGESAAKVRLLCEEALVRGPLIGEPDGGAQAAWVIAFCLSCCGRLPQAVAVLDDAIALAERMRLGLATTDLRALRAFIQLSRGLLAEAGNDAAAVLDGTDPNAMPTLGRPFAVFTLIEVHLLQNQTSAALNAFERYGVLDDTPHQTLFLPMMVAHGRLHIAQGNTEVGAITLLRTNDLLVGWGARCPAFISYASPVHALVVLGRTDKARAVAAEHLAAARAFGEHRVVASALCAAARTVAGSAAIDLLEEAVRLLQGSDALIDECAALLQLGSALRAEGQTAQARCRLREASEIADRVGAVVLGKQARQELSAMGVRVRQSTRTGVSGLTPRECRVSLLAAEGKRNQEIARILFVTVKTVEWHLSQAYRKLGIASRAELRQALGRH